MYKNCATEESARRQRQLEQCLLELMLTEAYGQITISDICDRAGLSRKSFYRYFSSKDGCLYALIDHTVFDGGSFYLPNHTDVLSLPTIHERFFRYWREQQPLLDALVRNDLSVLLIQRVLNYSIQEEREFQFHPFNTPDHHERMLFYVGGVMGLLLDWQQNGFQKTPLQMSKILTELIR